MYSTVKEYARFRDEARAVDVSGNDSGFQGDDFVPGVNRSPEHAAYHDCRSVDRAIRPSAAPDDHPSVGLDVSAKVTIDSEQPGDSNCTFKKGPCSDNRVYQC
jgi:hypothetical protein